MRKAEVRDRKKIWRWHAPSHKIGQGITREHLHGGKNITGGGEGPSPFASRRVDRKRRDEYGSVA